MKPLVNYKYPPLVAPRKMSRAVVEPINHPGHDGLVSNTKPVLTSMVIAVHNNGEFETENTYYAPEEK